MRDFTFENQALGSFLVYRLAPEESLDRTAVGMLTYNQIPGLLPVSCMYVDDAQILRYQISSLTALMGYWGGPAGRKKLLTFLSSFCRAVLECQEYMLDPGRLVLDWDHVFVEPLSGEIRLAYLPVEGGASPEAKPEAFLRELIQRTTFDPTEDGSHVAVIFNALNSGSFSVEQFDAQLRTLTAPAAKKQPPARPIKEAEPLPVQRAPAPQPAPPPAAPAAPSQTPPAPAAPAFVPPQPAEKQGGFSLLGGGKGQKPAKPKKEKKGKAQPQVQNFGFAVPGSPAAPASPAPAPAPPSAPAPVQGKEKRGLLGLGKKKDLISPAPPQPAPPPVQAPVPLVQTPVPPRPVQPPAAAGQGGHTVPLGGGQISKPTLPLGQQEEGQTSKGLILLRRLNGQRAPIDKPIFHVGRESQVVDFCVTGGHDWVGKDHAYFLVKEDGCYLVDNNSMNHTWLNGQQLVSNQMYPVKAGDIIKMADEEFELLPG